MSLVLEEFLGEAGAQQAALSGGTAFAETAPAPVAPAANPNSYTVTLKQLGRNYPMTLRGVDSTDSVSFNVRADSIVTGAKLNLEYAYSPALLAAGATGAGAVSANAVPPLNASQAHVRPASARRESRRLPKAKEFKFITCPLRFLEWMGLHDDGANDCSLPWSWL